MQPAILAPEPELKTKRFTRRDVARVLEAGVFEGQRFELIGGELMDKMGQNPPHASTIHRILDLLIDIFGRRRVLVQAPIAVTGPDSETSEPEPDLAILPDTFDLDELEVRHPNATELALAIDVSDTTTKFDTTIKRDLYARTGLREYWVLDINRGLLHIHRKPTSAGLYSEVRTLDRSQTVTVAGHRIQVAKMLPAARQA